MSLYRAGFNCYLFVKDLFSETKQEEHIMKKHIVPPWLWIGMELHDGTIVDRTEEVQELIDEGFPITFDSISEDINDEKVKRYFYLDAKTLNEEEFPPEGLLINDTRK